MRTVFAILLCVLAMSRYPALALRQIAAWTAQSATPGLPSTTQTPPRPSPSGSVQKAVPPTPATAALRCIQNALGGTNEVAALSSVRFVGKTKPTATTRPLTVRHSDRNRHGVPGPVQTSDRADRWIAVPEEHGRVQRRGAPGKPESARCRRSQGDAEGAAGICQADADAAASGVGRRPPFPARGARRRSGATHHPAFSPALVATLWRTSTRACLSHFSTRKSPWRKARTLSGVDLSEYRRFGGIRFPTLLRQAKNGPAWEDEYDVNVEVNASFDDRYFRQ